MVSNVARNAIQPILMPCHILVPYKVLLAQSISYLISINLLRNYLLIPVILPRDSMIASRNLSLAAARPALEGILDVGVGGR